MKAQLLVIGFRRLNNSPSGNPRFQIAFRDAPSAITAPDIAASYDFDHSWIGKWLNVRFDENGMITEMERVNR